jgi:Phage integrase family
MTYASGNRMIKKILGGRTSPRSPGRSAKVGDARIAADVHRMFERVNARAGATATLHSLRHTAAYRMAEDPSLPLTDVQLVLGHAQLTTTEIYLTQGSGIASDGRESAGQCPFHAEVAASRSTWRMIWRRPSAATGAPTAPATGRPSASGNPTWPAGTRPSAAMGWLRPVTLATYLLTGAVLALAVVLAIRAPVAGALVNLGLGLRGHLIRI